MSARPPAPEPASRVEVRFDRAGLTSGRAGLARASRDLVSAAAGQLGYGGAAVSLLFCSMSGMQRLNRLHLGEDRPTDVLSFPAQRLRPARISRGIEHLGDIAICLPYVATSEGVARRSLAGEVALLIVHGVLHLAGHDHDTADRMRVMWAETRSLLALPEARAFAALRLGVRS